MADFDIEINREFWSIVRADEGMTSIELAAQDFRTALYTRHDFNTWDASGLLAEVMEEYVLEPEDMMQVVKMGEQILRGGGYV